MKRTCFAGNALKRLLEWSQKGMVGNLLSAPYVTRKKVCLHYIFTYTKRQEFKSMNKAKVSVRAKQAIVII